VNHDDRSAAEREAPRKHDPCDDDVRIGRVTETMPDVSSHHETVVVENTAGGSEWLERVDQSVGLSSYPTSGKLASLSCCGTNGACDHHAFQEDTKTGDIWSVIDTTKAGTNTRRVHAPRVPMSFEID
jgi:hypothetical protein